MEIEGNIRKMRTTLERPVVYDLRVGQKEIRMNDLIGTVIKMEYLHEIHCIKCGSLTKKSFAQGFCYPCFLSAPEAEECVLRPELCRAHEGQARDMDYATKNCLIEHVVYLSLTSDLKVGVTRSTQVPTRWIDQGAVAAIELARTPNRYTAGMIEVFFKGFMKDKTNWRTMLKNENSFSGDLVQEKHKALALLPDDLFSFRSLNDDVTEIQFPVSLYPEKIVSLNFDKESVVQGNLLGIKGQYLFFENGKVLNIRKFGGYKLRISF